MSERNAERLIQTIQIGFCMLSCAVIFGFMLESCLRPHTQDVYIVGGSR